MPAATFESVYQSVNLKRDTSSRPQGSPDGSTPKKPKVELEDVKELVQVVSLNFLALLTILFCHTNLLMNVQEQEVRKAIIMEDADQENEDLDDFLPVADNDAEDFEDDAEEATCDSMEVFQSQSAPSTPPCKQNAPKPILKVLLLFCF